MLIAGKQRTERGDGSSRLVQENDSNLSDKIKKKRRKNSKKIIG